MRPHTQLYMEHFGYDHVDETVCEITGNIIHDVHHIKFRGIGGTSKAENIENLMGLTTWIHEYAEKNGHLDWWFKLVHMHFMVTRVPYSEVAAKMKDPIYEKMMDEINLTHKLRQ